MIPLAQEHPLPSGDLLVLLSLEVWSDWLDLRYAVVYATPEPEGAATTGGDRLLRGVRPGRHPYTARTGSYPSYGMVRVNQRTFVPSPPEGTELLELRFSPPDTMPDRRRR